MEQVPILKKKELLGLKLSELVSLLEKVNIMPISEENTKYSKLISKVIAIKGEDLIQ